MPRVSAAFFTLTFIYLLIGMVWGQYMGASEDTHCIRRTRTSILSAAF